MLPLQAFLYTVEEKTGLTPRELLEVAEEKGFGSADTKASEVKAWLKAEFGLGPGHALLIFHLVQNDHRNKGSSADRREDLDALWLDGKASAPAG